MTQGEMSVIEYAVKFNELSRFAPNQMATEEMRMVHFEQGLKGEVKQTIVGDTYANFQEIYQMAVKVAHIINMVEIENREKGQAKKKFCPRGSNSQGNINFRRFKTGMRQDKEKQPVQ